MNKDEIERPTEGKSGHIQEECLWRIKDREGFDIKMNHPGEKSNGH
jgi:hypothetical protein